VGLVGETKGHEKRWLAAFSPDHAALRASKRHEASSDFPKTLDLAKQTQAFRAGVGVDWLEGQGVMTYVCRFDGWVCLGLFGVFLAPVSPLHHDFHVGFGFGRLWAYQS